MLPSRLKRTDDTVAQNISNRSKETPSLQVEEADKSQHVCLSWCLWEEVGYHSPASHHAPLTDAGLSLLRHLLLPHN